MKFTMSNEKIQEVYTRISKLMNAKSPVPILSGALVQANEDCLLFTVSDATESLVHRVPIEDETVIVEEKGAAVLSKETLEVSRKLKGNVHFEANDSTISVEKDKTKLEFSIMPADEYPKIDIKKNESPIVFTATDFQGIIAKTAFAASDSETRPILQGVNLKLSKEGNVFSCTDSHRLSRITSGTHEEELDMTVPAKMLEHVAKSLNSEQDVMIFTSDSNLSIVNGNTIYYSRLLEGNYPNVSGLIPTDFSCSLVVNRKEFIDTLELLAIITTNGVVKLSVDGLFVELMALGETSKGSKQVAFESYDGDEDFEIAFSALYVIDALKAINSNSVTISFCGPMRPFVIKPTNEEKSDNELQLVLPVRTF